MRVVNTFRTWNGPPKFYIELEADWFIILDEIRGKSPGLKKHQLRLFSNCDREHDFDVILG